MYSCVHNNWQLLDIVPLNVWLITNRLVMEAVIEDCGFHLKLHLLVPVTTHGYCLWLSELIQWWECLVHLEI